MTLLGNGCRGSQKASHALSPAVTRSEHPAPKDEAFVNLIYTVSMAVSCTSNVTMPCHVQIAPESDEISDWFTCTLETTGALAKSSGTKTSIMNIIFCILPPYRNKVIRLVSILPPVIALTTYTPDGWVPASQVTRLLITPEVKSATMRPLVLYTRRDVARRVSAPLPLTIMVTAGLNGLGATIKSPACNTL